MLIGLEQIIEAVFLSCALLFRLSIYAQPLFVAILVASAADRGGSNIVASLLGAAIIAAASRTQLGRAPQSLVEYREAPPGRCRRRLAMSVEPLRGRRCDQGGGLPRSVSGALRWGGCRGRAMSEDKQPIEAWTGVGRMRGTESDRAWRMHVLLLENAETPCHCPVRQICPVRNPVWQIREVPCLPVKCDPSPLPPLQWLWLAGDGFAA